MTDVVGNPEEERRAEFYHEPWSQEAVSRYFYCKVSLDLRPCVLAGWPSCLLACPPAGRPPPSFLQTGPDLILISLQIQQRRQELEQSLGVRNT